jgi:hypothetical protein
LREISGGLQTGTWHYLLYKGLGELGDGFWSIFVVCVVLLLSYSLLFSSLLAGGWGVSYRPLDIWEPIYMFDVDGLGRWFESGGIIESTYIYLLEQLCLAIPSGPGCGVENIILSTDSSFSFIYEVHISNTLVCAFLCLTKLVREKAF